LDYFSLLIHSEAEEVEEAILPPLFLLFDSFFQFIFDSFLIHFQIKWENDDFNLIFLWQGKISSDLLQKLLVFFSPRF